MKKIAEMIYKAKDVMGGFCCGSRQEIPAELRKLREEFCEKEMDPQLARDAFNAVLNAGIFCEDMRRGTQFMLPATRDALEAYEENSCYNTLCYTQYSDHEQEYLVAEYDNDYWALDPDELPEYGYRAVLESQEIPLGFRWYATWESLRECYPEFDIPETPPAVEEYDCFEFIGGAITFEKH